MKPSSHKLRYPGVKPFSKDERELFFGRAEESDQLKKLMQLETLSVLYGKSGLGKSSLLLAGVMPLLEEEGRECHYIRFGSYTQYSDSLLTKTKDTLRHSEADCFQGLDEQYGDSIWAILKSRSIKTGKPQTLVFDQFEEVFTYPEKEIKELEKSLAQVLYQKPPSKIREYVEQRDDLSEEEKIELASAVNAHILLAIRSDRMSQLNSLSGSIPAILKHCYEILPLTRQGAEDAILLPAYHKGDHFASPIFDYSDEALDKMLAFLTKDNQQQVEGFTLQIVCQYAEQLVIKGQTGQRGSMPLLEEKHLGDLQEVYQGYYDQLIYGLGNEEVRKNARKLVEEDLIFEEEERRISLDEAVLTRSMGVSAELLSKLTNSHLLRVEVSSSTGGRSYEISHDTLIEPILKSKNERLAKKQRKTYRQRMMAVATVSLIIVALVGFSLSYELYTQEQDYNNAYLELSEAIQSTDQTGRGDSPPTEASPIPNEEGVPSPSPETGSKKDNEQQALSPAEKLRRLSHAAASQLKQAQARDSIVEQAMQDLVAKLKAAQAGSEEEQKLASELLQVMRDYPQELGIPMEASNMGDNRSDERVKPPELMAAHRNGRNQELPGSGNAPVPVASDSRGQEGAAKNQEYKNKANAALRNRRYRKAAEVLREMKALWPRDNFAHQTLNNLKNKIQPKMVEVKAGAFKMGCTQEEANCQSDELPVQTVKIDGFHISKFEVTNQQFAHFLNDLVYDPQAPMQQGQILDWVGLTKGLEGVKSPLFRVRGSINVKDGYEQHPVMYISWHAAQKYCQWLSEVTGDNFRLPTEAEWEYAARGGHKARKTLYAGGSDYNSLAWHAGNIPASEKGPRPVGQKKPNELGLYDMSGNVWEWCADYYGNYTPGTKENPKRSTPGKGRVIRGGSWLEGNGSLRLSYRGHNEDNAKLPSIGFRCARD